MNQEKIYSRPGTSPPETGAARRYLTPAPRSCGAPADLWEVFGGGPGADSPYGLLNLPQSPRICEIDAAVCFADVRGFSAYCNELQRQHQDGKVENFLKTFLGVLPRSLQRMLRCLEPTADWKDSASGHAALLRRLVVPTSYKNLGDGCMLVWEFPPDLSNGGQALLGQAIFQMVLLFYEEFSNSFHRLNPLQLDAYSTSVSKLKLGLGLAKGRLWKLDLGPGLKSDYAGSIVNLAAHLQGAARPEGILCQRQFSRGLFDRLIAGGIGVADKVSLKGENEQEAVWFVGDEVRQSRDILYFRPGRELRPRIDLDVAEEAWEAWSDEC